MKALTQDEAVVLSALEGSTVVSIVDGRLKSAVKLGRNTIILREIPADTAEADIREIFNYPGCKPITSVKSDIGDTWFVVMESEADAKDTVLDLKLKKRMFNGESVKARLKSEAVVNRSHYPNKPPIASSVYPVMYPYGAGAGQVDVQQFNFGAGGQSTAEGSSQGRTEDSQGNSGKGSRTDRERRVNGGKVGSSGSRDGGNNSRSGNDSGNRKGGNSNTKRDGQRSSPRDTAPIEINSLNFPPLPPQGPGGEEGSAITHAQSTLHANAIPYATISAGGATTTAAAPVAPAATIVVPESTEDYSTIGYGDKPFAKYQIDDIINIVKNIKEAVLPETIHTTEHPLAMEVSPNVDLLLRQRTFSIDETREQMQQGRPVQRDAVISGAVDYNSVMYGEDTSSEGQATKTQTEQASNKKAGGGSWAGVLKSTAAIPPPAPTKTGPPRATAPAAKAEPTKGKSDAGKKDGKSKGVSSSRKEDKGNKGGDKKDGRGQRSGGGRRNDQKEKEPTGPPLRWGDKPSFANVLKAKEDGSPSTSAPAAPVQQRKQRSRSNSESSNGVKNQQPSAEDGTWSKQKLPPLKKSDP
jgi:hypothetical protein